MSDKVGLKKLLCCAVIVIEILLVILAYFSYCRGNKTEIMYDADSLVYDTGEAGCYLDKNYSYEYVSTPAVELPKGWYTLNINCDYKSEVTTRLEIIYADDDSQDIINDEIPLRGEKLISYDFGVKYGNRPVAVRARLSNDADAANGDYVLVNGVSISTAPYNSRYFIFCFAALFLLIDLLFLLYNYRNKFNIDNKTKLRIKIILITTFVCSIPLFNNYLLDTHDLPFHLMRIEGIKDGLKAGMFPVKIQPSWMRGHGYAASVFYGDIFLYIPAFLRLFGIPIQTVYKLYVLCVNTATVLVSYYCFSRMGNEKTGLICSMIYSLNIYRLVCIYTRGAVGEYTAMIFFPLVLYGLWKVYTLPEGSKEHRSGWLPITFGCTGIFMSHIISSEIAAIFIIITALILWKRTFHKETFRVLIKSAAVTIALNIWFLAPFLDYMTAETYIVSDPDSYVRYAIENTGLFISQLFMNKYNAGDGSQTLEDGLAKEMPLTLGLGLMLVLFGWFLFCQGKENGSKAEKKRENFAVLLSLISIGMALYYFPYTGIAGLLPFVKMPVRSFQFAWRFLSVAGVLLTYLLYLILTKEKLDSKIKSIFAAVLITVSFAEGLSYMSAALTDNEIIRPMQAGDLDNTHIHGAEYIPIDLNDDDREGYKDYYVNELTYDESAIDLIEWHRDKYSVSVTLANHSGAAGYVEVPLLLYKGYHAYTDTGDKLDIAPGKSYRISVAVPAGFDGAFTVKFEEPWYWRVCELISLFTLAFIIVFCIMGKRKSGIEAVKRI